MTVRQSLLAVAAAAGAGLFPADAAIYDLERYGFSIDGNLYLSSAASPLPPQVNFAAFDTATGLGVIDLLLAGAGPHTVVAFFDHAIDQATNTFFNESGSALGAPLAGQTWEIDTPGTPRQGPGGDPAPGPYVGDIDINLALSDPLGSVLDGGAFESLCDPGIAGAPDRCDTPDDFTGAVTGSLVPLTDYETPVSDDTSVAMGWSFILAADETAYLRFVLSPVEPVSGFYLRHWDPDSDAGLSLSSSLRVVAAPVAPTLTLLLPGLLAVRARARRRGCPPAGAG